jgi:hypothetical protein
MYTSFLPVHYRNPISTEKDGGTFRQESIHPLDGTGDNFIFARETSAMLYDSPFWMWIWKEMVTGSNFFGIIRANLVSMYGSKIETDVAENHKGAEHRAWHEVRCRRRRRRHDKFKRLKPLAWYRPRFR